MANLVLAYKALLGPRAFVVFTKYHKSLEFGGRKVVSGGLYPVSMMREKRRELWLFFVVFSRFRFLGIEHFKGSYREKKPLNSRESRIPALKAILPLIPTPKLTWKKVRALEIFAFFFSFLENFSEKNVFFGYPKNDNRLIHKVTIKQR